MEEITMDMALAKVYELMDEIEDAKRIEYLKNLDHESLVDATNCLMNFYKMGLLTGRIMGMVQDGTLSDDEFADAMSTITAEFAPTIAKISDFAINMIDACSEPIGKEDKNNVRIQNSDGSN